MERLTQEEKEMSEKKMETYRYSVETEKNRILELKKLFREDELDAARKYAADLFENRFMDENIVLTEGEYDSDGECIDASKPIEIIEVWED